jgi:hypothetical protein
MATKGWRAIYADGVIALRVSSTCQTAAGAKDELMKFYVRDYDEMPVYDERKTWEWLEDRGCCVRERERMRTNQQQTIRTLRCNGQGKPAVIPPENIAWPDFAVPGEDPKGKGKNRPKGDGEDDSRSYDGASRIDGGQTSEWKAKNPASPDRRTAIGPCWFFAVGSCAHGADCARDHRKLTDAEKASPKFVIFKKKGDDDHYPSDVECEKGA